MTTRVAAIDLGASSARVTVVDLDRPAEVEVVHRHRHGPARWEDGTLRWDWARLTAEAERGLDRALEGGPLASIGVDTWGVDYGLVGRDGMLLFPPFSYRDARTDNWRRTAEALGPDRLYRTTGIQLMPINTVFQLAGHDRSEMEVASGVLMLPELLVAHLTGTVTGEVTSAGTTGLVDLATGGWAKDIIEEIGVDPALFPPIAPAATAVGTWQGIPVHLVGGHDTSSAVAAVPGPPAEGAAFVATGTWFLVGTERAAADVSDAARAANFSNEPGVLGGVRFLKNLTGLWLLEQCRAAWGDPPIGELMAAAAGVGGGGPTVDPGDERFLAPPDMEAEVRAAAGLAASAGRDAVVRCIVDSLAAATARVVDEVGRLQGQAVPEVNVVGGGVHLALLLTLLEEACGVPVRTGPAEAASVGNALVQGIALGRFDSLAGARRSLARSQLP